LPEKKNGRNRCWDGMTLRQLLDKIGELDEKQISVLGFWCRNFLIRGTSGIFPYY